VARPGFRAAASHYHDAASRCHSAATGPPRTRRAGVRSVRSGCAKARGGIEVRAGLLSRPAVQKKRPDTLCASGRSRNNSRQRPTLPHPCGCSTIGGSRLNFRVRNGNGCDPAPMTTGERAARRPPPAARRFEAASGGNRARHLRSTPASSGRRRWRGAICPVRDLPGNEPYARAWPVAAILNWSQAACGLRQADPAASRSARARLSKSSRPGPWGPGGG
jgi:hypothetical protein